METSMTDKHTPGPWKAEPLRGTKQLSIVPHYDDYDRRSVASVVAVSGEPEMNHEANARLIAAAPELLEALELAVKKVEACNRGDCAKHGYDLVSARAAIKATKGDA